MGGRRAEASRLGQRASGPFHPARMSLGRGVVLGRSGAWRLRGGGGGAILGRKRGMDLMDAMDGRTRTHGNGTLNPQGTLKRPSVRAQPSPSHRLYKAVMVDGDGSFCEGRGGSGHPRLRVRGLPRSSIRKFSRQMASSHSRNLRAICRQNRLQLSARFEH